MVKVNAFISIKKGIYTGIIMGIAGALTGAINYFSTLSANAHFGVWVVLVFGLKSLQDYFKHKYM